MIGAGWIGAEVGRLGAPAGSEVTLIERLEVPLERVLGTEVGRIYADVHREQGVELLTGVGVEALEGAGRVERVRLSDGRTLECGRPGRRRRRPAHGSGRGGRPRRRQRHPGRANLETSAPGVFAAGDVANP